MTLSADSMRNIQSFHFQKLGSVVQPSCVSLKISNLFKVDNLNDSFLDR